MEQVEIRSEDREIIPRRVLVLLLESVHALDFGGPVQAVYEANGFGARYRLQYVGPSREVRSAQGFHFGAVEPLPAIQPDDWVIVPGIESTELEHLDAPVDWIRDAVEVAHRVSSVCSGAFILAQAGVLDGRSCTTHWKVISTLRAWSPTARVLENRLFVRDGNVVTSAGESAGIDMALAQVHEDCGPRIAANVAREMVVYFRRSGDSAQESVYLQHRDHMHPGVHRVQDWIVEHPERRATIDDLAELAAVSPRHLTRVFREATGTTLTTFAHKVKLEVARALAEDPMLTMEAVAARCGFADARQLRRLWRVHYGTAPRGGKRRIG